MAETEQGGSWESMMDRGEATLMSRNLYLGADTSLVIGSFLDGADDLEVRAREAHRQLLTNDFFERGEALVDEIQDSSPHVVAMQEVVKVAHRTRQGQATIDYRSVLDGILRRRGMPYEFLSSLATTVVDLGFESGDRLTFTDHLALLIRRDVQVLQTRQDRFEATQPTPGGITLRRGWMAVDCLIGGLDHRFVNTHLEVQAFPDCQARQVDELLGTVLHDPSVSTFLMGDFNTNAVGREGDPTWTPAYDSVRDAGFRDLWSEVTAPGPREGADSDPGFTCCHDPDLSVQGKGLDQRIDFIFYRGQAEIEVLDMRRVGADPASRTPNRGLWPSDHAGLVARVAVSSVGS